MIFRENSINDFFNSKAFALLMALAMIVISYLEIGRASCRERV